MRIKKALISAAILVLALSSAAWAGEEQTSYGYVRTLEGSGAIVSADTNGVTELQLNHPVLTGDRLVVDPMSRVELVLPDFNIVRVGGDSELELSRLAFSADTEERLTTLLLMGGEMQIVVTEYALGDELPAVVLPNATAFLHEPGSYRITAYQDLSRVVVRTGYAEVSTERGSAIARADEMVQVEGTGWPTVAVQQASYADDLEQWGDGLMIAAEYVDPGDVDPALSYSASSMSDAGEWVDVDGASAWSPYVEESWRPYTRGTWTTTPAGMYWVGYEPWGWVTGHYGYWSLHDYHGWLWYPGAAWAPAWVHWYWGPNYVGWVPFGYYNRFYGGHLGLSLGYYGYAGGYWHHYNDWTFCPTSYLGRGNDHYYSGRDMPRRTGRTAVPRGVITTDTRGINSVNWRDGVAVGEALTAEARRAGRTRGSTDVTAFVARERDLPADVAASIRRGDRLPAERRAITRQPAVRSDGGPVSSGRDRHVISTGRTRHDRPSALSRPSEQVWRSSGRRIYTVDRGSSPGSAERGRQSAFESAARVRDAWRGESVDRRGHRSYDSRGRTDLGRSHSSRYGVGSPRSSSPARRVIEGVTSPSRGQTRSSTPPSTRSRPGQSQPSTRTSSGSSGSSNRSSATRSSGSRRSSSASGRSSSSGRSKSGGGKASSSRSGGSRRSGGKG